MDGFAAAIERAIHMPPDEQRSRMRAMRRVVAGHNVFLWASDILEGLEGVASSPSLVRGPEVPRVPSTFPVRKPQPFSALPH